MIFRNRLARKKLKKKMIDWMNNTDKYYKYQQPMIFLRILIVKKLRIRQNIKNIYGK
jgi:hypothetical protein